MSLAVLCPGQGGQHPGMFDILAQSAQAVEAFDQAALVCGMDFRALVGIDLFANCIAQPLVCAFELAVWAGLRDSLPAPLIFAGYSVGELAAYGCAGALSLSETLELAQCRADLMDAASPRDCALLAVQGLRRSAVQALCERNSLEIAIVNGADHFVIGGRSADLKLAAEAAIATGARAVPLKVAVPAHTSMLDKAVPEFESALRASELRSLEIPVLTGINATPIRDRAAAIETLSQQVARPIEWAKCVEAAVEMGARVLLELGPGNALSRMVRDAYPDLASRSVAEFRSLDGVVTWVRASF